MFSWQCELFSFLLFLASCSYVSLLAHSLSSVHPPCPDQERSALLHFKQTFHIDCTYASDSPSAYPKVESWAENQDCCSWDGVKCDEEGGHVIALNLSSSCLYGTFSPNCNLFSLTHLQELSFADNNFNSSPIPSELAQLTNLEKLDLLHSGFSGSLPSSLGNLTKLAYLDVCDNDLSGYIPFSLANVTQLKHLGLSGLNVGRHHELHSLLSKLTEVTDLVLTSMNLATEIPSFIANLTRLEYLNLGESHLLGQIPVWLMNHTRLEGLLLRGNLLEGPIPQEISQLINLDKLVLSDNDNLYGNFNPFLKLQFLTNLQLDGVKLSFSDNSITNKSYPMLKLLSLSSSNLTEFPQFLRSQDELETLDLSRNQIHGTIPQWLVNITRDSLRTLNLSHNFLTAFEHPVLMWNCLEVLQLSGNLLQGSLSIPPTSLKVYQVSDNQLVGSIPQQICHASSLNYLDLSNNNLGGQIPDCISGLASSLMILNLQGNNFLGIIPGSYSKSCKLKIVSLSQNQLEGSLPRSLVNCTMLVLLDIGRNQMKDTFPSWLGVLPKLQILILAQNNFYGRIMDRSLSMGNFPSLNIIDLSRNSYVGDLPSDYLQISGTRNKVNVDIRMPRSGTMFHCSSLDYPIILTLINHDLLLTHIVDVFHVIDFSGNNFTGKIPEFIGEARGLVTLNLSNNNLEGRIPSSLSKLTNLESLDLSMNMLSGGIPRELTQLTFLEIINVSHNLLVGPIPEGVQFDSFDASFFDGNQGLCGEPRFSKCENVHESPSLTSNEESYSDVIGWLLRGVGCVGGFAVGCAVGQYITDQNHEWFVETFGRRRMQRQRAPTWRS